MSKPWPPPRAAELDLDALEVLADVAIDAAKEDTAYTPWADASDVAAGEFKPEECEFVAACSPSTVKALIARVRGLREELDMASTEVDFARSCIVGLEASLDQVLGDVVSLQDMVSEHRGTIREVSKRLEWEADDDDRVEMAAGVIRAREPWLFDEDDE